MRNPPPSQTRPNTWIGHKDQGANHYQQGNYEEALASYRASLNPEYGCPSSQRQIILSNVVACRLKIGGPAQARAAVEEAKQCIALNPQWAKGHVRLASAYIELGGHSNDACNELQRALALDPGNPTARQMLVRELRRDRYSHPIPSAPPEEQDETNDDSSPPPPPPQNPFSSASNESSTSSERPPEDEDVGDPLRDDTIDESLSWSDRLKFQTARVVTWYESQSDDTKTVFKVILAILFLYVAFGGRFGLDSLFGGRHENRGNYERGNAYDRYYHRTANNHYSSSSGSGRQTSSHGYDNDYEYRPRQRRSNHILSEGGITSFFCLAGIVYLCHRNNINPFHALMMVNMFTGNRRRARHMGLAGMGYGAYRGAYGGRGRRRNGWY